MSPEAASHLFVLFGGTGDLARRKLLPAVQRLSRDGLLQGRWAVLGVARRTDLDDAGYRAWVRQALRDAGVGEDELRHWCDDCLYYHSMGGDSDPADAYRALAARIEAIEARHELPGNRLFYLALPPRAFVGVLDGLGGQELLRGPGWTRVVVEKPIGHDLQSATELESHIHRWLDEEQVFRIDHYLGKETVQNLLVLRFGNAMFEALFNRQHVENVQITVAEDIGVEGRAGYYDRSGALRDMVQNHLTQLLTLIAMEVPAAYDAASVRYEKIKVLRSVRPLRPEHVVRGQYIATGDAPGYLDDPDVPEGSTTETFAALRLDVDNWRWQGVPFYLRTGKRLPRRVTEIAVVFRRPPVQLFESMRCTDVQNEALVLRLQPDEAFSLYLDVKRPGEPMRLERIPLDFDYAEHFEDFPDAYTTLLLDVVQGDQTLFVHHDEVVESWKLYSPLVENEAGRRVFTYAAGSWGPGEADLLLEREGHTWLTR